MRVSRGRHTGGEMKTETAWKYFFRVTKGKTRRVDDGRAALELSPSPGDDGGAQPRLWLCRQGKSLVSCDDTGEFLESVSRTETNAYVVRRWKRHHADILAERANRRAARKGTSTQQTTQEGT